MYYVKARCACGKITPTDAAPVSMKTQRNKHTYTHTCTHMHAVHSLDAFDCGYIIFFVLRPGTHESRRVYHEDND
jgi:hypothetical protein